MLALLLFIFISSSQKIVEYKFWKKYGKVIFDYSLQKRHATNGHNLANTNDESVITDRGVFLVDHQSLKCLQMILKEGSRYQILFQLFIGLISIIVMAILLLETVVSLF